MLALKGYLFDEDHDRLEIPPNQIEDVPLPEQATLEEAITLYLADACSLGRAAELAGMTRWDIIDQLKECGIPILVYHTHSAQEMDTYAGQLEREGYLPPSS